MTPEALGKDSEQRVRHALHNLKMRNVIIDFWNTTPYSEDDMSGIDFWVKIKNPNGLRVTVPLQVKSSQYGLLTHLSREGQDIACINGQMQGLKEHLEHLFTNYFGEIKKLKDEEIERELIQKAKERQTPMTKPKLFTFSKLNKNEAFYDEFKKVVRSKKTHAEIGNHFNKSKGWLYQIIKDDYRCRKIWQERFSADGGDVIVKQDPDIITPKPLPPINLEKIAPKVNPVEVKTGHPVLTAYLEKNPDLLKNSVPLNSVTWDTKEAPPMQVKEEIVSKEKAILIRKLNEIEGQIDALATREKILKEILAEL